jgi:hypothetical protein
MQCSVKPLVDLKQERIHPVVAEEAAGLELPNNDHIGVNALLDAVDRMAKPPARSRLPGPESTSPQSPFHCHNSPTDLRARNTV